jgi:protein TonB
MPLNFQGGERSASNYLISTASRLEIREHKTPDPEGSAPGKKAGGGGGLSAKVHPSSVDIDQVLQQIVRKIEAAKRYPRAARKMGIEGTTVVRFKLKPQGQVEAVEIAESSGSEILDHASLQTVRDAAPLPYKEGWLKVGIVFKIL